MFRGSIVALITPMLDDKVDVVRLRELVEFHIQEGTHGIVAAGTTGESGTLTTQEKLLVIKTVVDQAQERLPVIAGTGANSTKQCVELTQLAMSNGAHAALIMTPAYIKPTQEGLYQHYRHVAESAAMPIILYNVPSRTGCDLLPETVIRLSGISNIIGVKEATGELTRLHCILEGSDGDIDVYSGDDLTAAPWLLAGSKGVISVTANVAPRLMAKLSDAAVDGDEETCLQIHEQLMPLHKLLFIESNPIPVKWAAYKMGLLNDEIRLPLTRLSSQYHDSLERVLRDLELNKLPFVSKHQC
ncbi:MAG: 4-hydroxy-tetrahydrodipicolinate synthase [Legionellaceae bacterium]|nr:4-hydroxy-tetrahydrodipicolinate synthase [Legionellaceae bacterium]